MLSMTGYGRGEYLSGGIRVCVEIKTVNNRYLDAQVKSPRIFSPYDDAVRARVREKLTRGKADVFITFTDRREREGETTCDLVAAAAYVKCAEALRKQFPRVKYDFSITSLMKMPDVLKSEDNPNADERLEDAMFSALDAALENLNIMRLNEGKKLAADMLSRMDEIERLVQKITARAPKIVEEYTKKLKDRVAKYLEGVQVDEGRFLTEITLYADKTNIDEELTRLCSHIAQFREICTERLVGRKLDFLVQEFNREANTICSKSNDIEITKLALALKNEIEKVREQVQNVE